MRSSTYTALAVPSIDTQARMHQALAHATRLHILRILDSNPGTICVDELVDRLGELDGLIDIAQPTVSHHLRILRLSGLIEVERKQHTHIYYRVRHDALQALREAMV